MKLIRTSVLALISTLLFAFSAQAEEAVSTVGVAGYDLVSYHTGKKPLPGNGNHVVKHEGVSLNSRIKCNIE